MPDSPAFRLLKNTDGEKAKIYPATQHCKRRTGIHPVRPHCWWWKGYTHCTSMLLAVERDKPFMSIHCKKSFTIFPSPAGMSLTKLSLAGNNLIVTGQGEFG
jgi:hypothetical protein